MSIFNKDATVKSVQEHLPDVEILVNLNDPKDPLLTKNKESWTLLHELFKKSAHCLSTSRFYLTGMTGITSKNTDKRFFQYQSDGCNEVAINFANGNRKHLEYVFMYCGGKRPISSQHKIDWYNFIFGKNSPWSYMVKDCYLNINPYPILIIPKKVFSTLSAAYIHNLQFAQRLLQENVVNIQEWHTWKQAGASSHLAVILQRVFHLDGKDHPELVFSPCRSSSHHFVDGGHYKLDTDQNRTYSYTFDLKRWFNNNPRKPKTLKTWVEYQNYYSGSMDGFARHMNSMWWSKNDKCLVETIKECIPEEFIKEQTDTYKSTFGTKFKRQKRLISTIPLKEIVKYVQKGLKLDTPTVNTPKKDADAKRKKPTRKPRSRVKTLSSTRKAA